MPSKIFLSPPFIKAMAILFLSEAAVMGVMGHVFPELEKSWLGRYVADPLMMLLIGAPLICFFVLKPERKKRKKVEFMNANLNFIIEKLWSTAFSALSLKETIDLILKEIIENSCISIQKKGGIFLRENGEFRLKAHRGFNEHILKTCSVITPGKCLCGKVLETGKYVYKPEIDSDHEISYQGIVAHGHYCLPIRSGENLLGVLNLYVEPGHPFDRNELAYLESISSIIGKIVENKNLETRIIQAQKMESIGKAAGMIAHDFNNILAAAGGYASLIKTGLDRNEPVNPGDLREIENAVEKGREMARRLLAFSKRKETVEMERLDLNNVVSSSLPMMRKLVGADITVGTSLSADLPEITGNKGLLEQVIMNLVVNARDAISGAGEITISTSRHAGDEDPAYNNMVRLAVADSGSGMSEEVLENVFDLFFTTKKSGTGLGLPIIHGITAQHKGLVNVKSAPGKGTTFEIFLPASAEDGNNPSKP